MELGSLYSYFIGKEHRGQETANYGITHKPIYLNKTLLFTLK